MISLRRYYHRHFGHHGRFHLAVILTIVVVAYVIVPVVLQYAALLGGYEARDYEPKDAQRHEWLSLPKTVERFTRFSWETVLGAGLFILVAVVWLTLVPSGITRRRSRR